MGRNGSFATHIRWNVKVKQSCAGKVDSATGINPITIEKGLSMQTIEQLLSKVLDLIEEARQRGEKPELVFLTPMMNTLWRYMHGFAPKTIANRTPYTKHRPTCAAVATGTADSQTYRFSGILRRPRLGPDTSGTDGTSGGTSSEYGGDAGSKSAPCRAITTTKKPTLGIVVRNE